jgi:hypothetical protein
LRGTMEIEVEEKEIIIKKKLRTKRLRGIK